MPPILFRGVMRVFRQKNFFDLVTNRSRLRLIYESEVRAYMDVNIEKIYELYFMQVYSFVMTLVKNPDIAEEITQNTFFKAMQSSFKHREEASELTWLCTIAKNLYIDEYRKRKKSSPFSSSDDIADDSSFEEKLENKESSYQIHCILHALEEPYKEVFHLRLFGELPFKTIGAIFGRSESWARITYHRAKIKIRERLDNNDE